MFRRADLLGRLAEIDCPTLVMCGAEDAAQPPPKSEAIAAGIRGARFESIPRAGHLSALEDPAAVTEPMLGFLASYSW